MALDTGEVPIVSSFKEHVRQEVTKEIESKINRVEIFLPVVIRIFCLIAALGVFYKPIAIIFFIYPFAELYFSRPINHIHPVEYKQVPIEATRPLEMADIDPDLKRPNTYEEKDETKIADF